MKVRRGSGTSWERKRRGIVNTEILTEGGKALHYFFYQKKKKRKQKKRKGWSKAGRGEKSGCPHEVDMKLGDSHNCKKGKSSSHGFQERRFITPFNGDGGSTSRKPGYLLIPGPKKKKHSLFRRTSSERRGRYPLVPWEEREKCHKQADKPEN